MKKKKSNTFLANKEWSKDIKFNNHWYHLTALFDKGSSKLYNFNNSLLDIDNGLLNIAKKTKKKSKPAEEPTLLNDGNRNFDFNKALLEDDINRLSFNLDDFDSSDSENYIHKDDSSEFIKDKNKELQNKTTIYGANPLKVLEKLLNVSSLNSRQSLFYLSEVNNLPVYMCDRLSYVDDINMRELLENNNWIRLINMDEEKKAKFEEFLNKHLNEELYVNMSKITMSPDFGMQYIEYIDRKVLFCLTGEVEYKDCFGVDNIEKSKEFKQCNKKLSQHGLTNPYKLGWLFKVSEDGNPYFETMFATTYMYSTYIIRQLAHAWSKNENIIIDPNDVNDVKEQIIKLDFNKQLSADDITIISMTIDKSICLYYFEDNCHTYYRVVLL